MNDAVETMACPHDTNGDGNCGLPACPVCGRGVRQVCTDLFRRSWHTLTALKRKDGQKWCYWCESPDTKLAYVNVWGTVFIVGACDACYPKHHGIMRDEL